MTTVQDRKNRLNMARKIVTAKHKLTREKAVALLSYNLGITTRKANEYLDVLLLVDGIKQVNGHILVKPKRGGSSGNIRK